MWMKCNPYARHFTPVVVRLFLHCYEQFHL